MEQVQRKMKIIRDEKPKDILKDLVRLALRKINRKKNGTLQICERKLQGKRLTKCILSFRKAHCVSSFLIS